MRTTRRKFLSVVGLAAAGPLILPRASALGYARNEAVRVGMIGMGVRGREILHGYLLGNSRVRVVAICDVDTTRREHHTREVNDRYANSDCASFNRHEDLLALDRLDAVVIATPDHWHATQALHAAMTGKDIYCEKPLTHTLNESRRIVEGVRAHQRVFQTGSQQRTEYDHKFVRAAELVRAGRIGKIISVNVGVGDPPKPCDLPGEEPEPGLDWDRWLGPTPERPYSSILSPRGVHGHYPAWRAYSDYCGGYLADMGAHHFDIAQWALDADASGPVRVEPPEGEDAMRGASLVFADGTRIVHGGPSGTVFVGTDGIIHVDRDRLVSMPAGLVEEDLPEGATTLPRHANHVENWLDCIASRERPICDVEVGARTATLCQLINSAYRLRRPLAWDWHAWRFAGDNAPNELLDYPRRASYPLP